jgi:hypothetical protein
MVDVRPSAVKGDWEAYPGKGTFSTVPLADEKEKQGEFATDCF